MPQIEYCFHLYLMQGQKYAKNEIEPALFEVRARLG